MVFVFIEIRILSKVGCFAENIINHVCGTYSSVWQIVIDPSKIHTTDFWW